MKGPFRLISIEPLNSLLYVSARHGAPCSIMHVDPSSQFGAQDTTDPTPLNHRANGNFNAVGLRA
jgi:hypothetical protein